MVEIFIIFSSSLSLFFFMVEQQEQEPFGGDSYLQKTTAKAWQ